jgi:multidrug efflux pump subunit AcrB
MGKKPLQAAQDATDEIGLAVVATSLTLVAIFLPTAFMGGIPGIVFRQFGIVASAAVLMSLLVARMLTPMMAAYWMKPAREEVEDGPVMRVYLRVARACLDRRKTTLAITGVFLILSVSLMGCLGTSFTPPADVSQTTVTLTLQPGSPLEETELAARRAAGIVAAVPDVRSVLTLVGRGMSKDEHVATNTNDTTSATLTVELTPLAKRNRTQSEIENDLRRALVEVPGARIEVGNIGNGNKLQITLSGKDPEALLNCSGALEKELGTLKGVGKVTSSSALDAPEIQIVPDFSRAAALGVTAEAIASVVRVATAGEYSAAMAKLNLPERQVPIRVRLNSNRKLLEAVTQLRVPGRWGEVTLGSIAEVKIGGAPAQITRVDRERNVTVAVELNGLNIGEVMDEARALPVLKNLPPGIAMIEQGETEQMSEMFTSFGIAMGIGVFCVYAVLVLLFHDFLQPITILMALPLALGGALLPLALTGTSFSLATAIGLLMLMGIATKNSILLVEYAVRARSQGMSRLEALLDACHKRARPIVMTTVAMGGGMLPVIVGLAGGDPSFRRPMGVVVIGGIVVSTVLSLVVIPVIFTFVDDFLQFVKKTVSGSLDVKAHEVSAFPDGTGLIQKDII